MKWRLGLDLGTNSLGWAAIALSETTNTTTGIIANKTDSILAAGSRIFSSGANGAGRDAKSGESLAVARRDARSMRRRRDRFKQRQKALLKYLVQDGLFPEDQTERKALETLDPYELRARALYEPLTLPELGRALFHLNQRRGFQSNRKTDRKEDDEAGKVAVGIGNLERAMAEAGARTLGEFLHLRRASAESANIIPSVRTRLRSETSEGAKGNAYEFYPGRHLLEQEFNEI